MPSYQDTSRLLGGLVVLVSEKRIDQLRNRTDLLRTIRMLSDAKLQVHDGSGLLSPSGAAVGIDGNMDYDEVLEMLLFFVTSAGLCMRLRISGNS